MSTTFHEAWAEGEHAAARYSLGVPRQAPIALAGGAMGHRAGSSLEFKEYREYQPGDDLRHIDWGVYARSDQLTIKLFREEVSPHVDIVLDRSRSMALAGTDKARSAVALTAFFAAAAANSGYTHAGWLMGEHYERVTGTRGRSVRWEEVDFSFRADPLRVPIRQPAAWRPRGIRVLLSDLLWAGDPMQIVGPLADRAAAVVVIQLLARTDVDPTPLGNLRLIDSETESFRDLYVDAALLRRYRDALTRHQQLWHHACRQVGANFVLLIAEDLLSDWDLTELVATELLRLT